MEETYIKIDEETFKSILSMGIRIDSANEYTNSAVLIDKLTMWYNREYKYETDSDNKHNYDIQLCFIANALAGVRKRNEFIRCLSMQ